MERHPTSPRSEAIEATLPLGSVAVGAAVDEKGQRLIWLEALVAKRLGALRGHGESYSDVIVRLAAGDWPAMDLK